MINLAGGTDPPLVQALALADTQAGIVSRPQLYGLGVTRSQLRAQLQARRWRRCLSQSVSVTTGALTQDARSWVALFEAGPRAMLDGVSSLQAAGLTGFESDRIRLSVPRGARVRRAPGLDVRQTRRWSREDLDVGSGIPRTGTDVAAVRAGLWARSDKQAALVLTMVVQQGLTTPERLGLQLLRIRRDRRRGLLHDVVLDLLGGARSVGEQEFAHACRSRGLPAPTRQALRRGRDGRYYLDALWEPWRVAVEVDGIHHGGARAIIGDALRQNALVLQGLTVLRLPLLGFRVDPDAFFGQIESALMAAGWATLDASA